MADKVSQATSSVANVETCSTMEKRAMNLLMSPHVIWLAEVEHLLKHDQEKVIASIFGLDLILLYPLDIAINIYLFGFIIPHFQQFKSKKENIGKHTA